MEDFIEKAFDYSSIGMAIVGLDGKWLKVNKSLCELLEYTEQEMLTKTFQDITFPEDLIENINCLNKLKKKEIEKCSFEKRYITKSGKIIWVFLTILVGKDKKDLPAYFFIQVQDITEKKIYQERILTALKNSKIGVWTWKADEDVLIWDETMFDLYETSPSEFTGKYEDFINRIYEEDRDKIQHAIDQCVINNQEYNVRFRLKINKNKHIKARAKITKDSLGDIFTMSGINYEITNTVLAEQQKEEAIKNLNIANKDMERFVYAVSHDLREPMRTIHGFAELLEETQNDKIDNEGKEYIKHINIGVKRLKDLLEDILNYTKAQSIKDLQKEDVDINKVIEEIINSYHIKIQETKGKIIFKNLPTIKSSSSLMFVLFSNLISNALKFHKVNETPVINICFEENEKQWIFKVIDNGIGIDSKYFKVIFDVFTRLQDRKVEGTGMGLSICKKVVERFGGNIWIESEKGKGSTFLFTLSKEMKNG